MMLPSPLQPERLLPGMMTASRADYNDKRKKSRKVQVLRLCAVTISCSSTDAFSSSMSSMRRGDYCGSRRRTRSEIRLAASTSSNYILSKSGVPQSASSTTATDESRSSFWYSTAATERVDSASPTFELPIDFDLDQVGELPPGAYMMLGNGEEAELKQSCRISVALNLLHTDEVEPDRLVSQLHAFVDSGFTSFQLLRQPNSVQECMEAEIVRRFRQDTPAYQIDRCKFTVPLEVPKHVSATSVRNAVLESLRRIGGQDLDCIQLQYKEGSLYHLDVLDALQDLWRDGFVRSVSAANLPYDIVKQARDYGLTVESNTIPCNILDPTDYKMHAAMDDPVPLILSSPLASGLLTDRFVRKSRSRQRRRSAGAKEQEHYTDILRTWKQRHDESINARINRPRDPYDDDDSDDLQRLLTLDIWQSFQTVLLDTIQEISRKHAVSMASVILRWILQLDKAMGTVVACRLASSEDEKSSTSRPQQLRQVFTFKLDKDDMSRLWELTGCAAAGKHIVNEGFSADEDEEVLEQMERQASGLFFAPQQTTKRAKNSTKSKTLFL